MKMAKSLTIDGVLSITPTTTTDPRSSCKVSITDQPLDNHGVLQKRMHIVLFYKKQDSDQDSTKGHVGGWIIRESLGRALVEQPILAGRLRKCDDNLEIVSNDSGVRCIVAKVPLSMVEFLQSKEMRQVEAELVYWKELDETNPQFSPLFYIQVTKFQCGGYSIGISCSLLLADPFFMANFLKRWSEIHANTTYKSEIPVIPFSYIPNPKRPTCFPPTTTATKKSSKTMMFSISTNNDKLNQVDEIYKYLLEICINEAKKKLGTKMSSNFILITKEPNGVTKVDKFYNQGIFGSPKSLKYELNLLSWEDLMVNEIVFQRENVPTDVSNWVASGTHEGVALLVISSPVEGKSGMTMRVYVTFPTEDI